MKYIVMILLSVMAFYMYTFAVDNWKKKNKIAAVGIVLLTLASIIFPLLVIFTG